MNFVKLTISQHGSYWYADASDIKMTILGNFFMADIRCSEVKFFRDWAVADKNDPTSKFCHTVGGNITFLEEEDDGYIYFTDCSSSERRPPELKMPREQLIKILDEWQNKVCEKMPKEVIIMHENQEFWIETKD